jgi:hypothetical protein
MTTEQCTRLSQLIEAVINAELDMSKAERMHTYITNAEQAKLEAHAALDKFKEELMTPDEPEVTEIKEK